MIKEIEGNEYFFSDSDSNDETQPAKVDVTLQDINPDEVHNGKSDPGNTWNQHH